VTSPLSIPDLPRDLRILIVEGDGAIAQLWRACILKVAPTAEIVVAKEGTEAVRLAARDAPHLVLTDVVLPKMDGLTTARALSANRSTAGIPVLAITSDGVALQDIIEAGCAGVLPKPVSMRELIVGIAGVLKTHRRPQ
jgi:CheY-like chemotaxis protein